MTTRRFTILAVDDEPLNLQILSSVLSHEFEVVVAASAEDAITRLRERKPDLILLDTMMPVIDGFDLCRVIKKDRSFADIPVIFVSALDSEAAQLQAFELGCIDYITKPLNLRLLKLRLRNLITLKEQRDQLARHKDELARMMAEMEAVNKRLQESEERWKFALEGSGDGLWDWDLASDTVYYSRQWKAMLGYGEDEIGNHLDEWRSRLHPEDRPAADADMQRHFRRETEVYSNEHRVLCKDGAYKWILGRGKVITWNGDGTPRRVIGIHTDVTERKRAAIELAHSHRLMQYIIEHNSAPIAVLDRELRHIYVSQSFLDDYGVKERDVIGKLHYEVFPDIPERWRDVHRRALAGEVLSSAEDPFPRADGSLDWTRWECRPWHNADSSIGGIILYTEVITAQVAARNALRYQDEMRRTILDKIPAMVALFKGGNYEFASHCFETTLGWSLEEVQQHRDILAEFYPDPACRQEVGDFLTECAGEWKDFKTCTRDGRSLDTSWMTVALSDGSILGIGIDISARKRIERDLVRAKEELMQAQKIESIGRLAGGVAHDFNNYLTTVGLHSELGLLDLDPGHPTSSHLVAIAQAAKKSAALTQQLLGFARKQAIAPKVLNLNEKIENMLKVLGPLLGENIDICWRPSAGLWQVKVDPTQVDQIVSNLCINSRDAIKHFGRIVVETSNTHLSTTFCAFNPGCTPGPYVVLAVKDNGCGMEKQVVDQIFDPFFTTKALGEGTGLGMATVYGIVKQNNGYITVESIPGHGTTVTIYLPQYEGDKNMQQNKPQKELPGGDETILVVEDDENISVVVKTLLEGQGYKVLTADGPGNALFIAQHAKRIDLILTDVIMPEMNGRELAENLMTLWPEAKTIFMSGYDDSIIARHGVVDEGLNFMPKPFSVPDLIAKVREVLDSAEK